MWTVLTILFVLFVLTTSESQVCDYWKSVELRNRTYNGVHYKENEYFVDNETGIERGCACMKGICARKCCPIGQGYNAGVKLCVDFPEVFDPPVWDENEVMEGFNVMKEFNFMFGKMNCSFDKDERRLPSLPAAKEIHLQTDGTLFVDIPNLGQILIYGSDKYCIDTFVSDRQSPHLNALICYVVIPEDNNYILSITCILTSCFFILLTVVIYACLSELRNLHGMVLMTYLLNFFVGFFLLATMQILIVKEVIVQETCTVLAFIIYFSLQSAFFWLNTMCYDIWWTFSGKRVHGQTGSPVKRFICYAAYAYGVPTVLTNILAALEFVELPIEFPLMPDLRRRGCFIDGTRKLFYLYGPIIILAVGNMIFFVLTVRKIAKIKKDTKVLRNQDHSGTHDQHKSDTQGLTLYVKLFTVMGINWIWITDFSVQITDAYNLGIGLITFYIFVCNKKTFRIIRKRYRSSGPSISATQTTSISTRTLCAQSHDEIQMNTI